MNIAVPGIQVEKFLIGFQSFLVVLGDKVVLSICEVPLEVFLILRVSRCNKNNK